MGFRKNFLTLCNDRANQAKWNSGNLNQFVMSSKKIQNQEVFSKALCDQLFQAVLVHDDLHLDAILPTQIHLDYSVEQFERCYQICWQVWSEGTSRTELLELLEKIAQLRMLDMQEQLAFKNMRAKFKHLRFAFVTLDNSHQYPRLFHFLTGEMGKLQDAFKNQQEAALKRSLFILKFFLKKLPYALITRRLNQFQPTSTANFQDYVNHEIHFIRAHLAQGEITSKIFHEMRKVISRQVALYDNLKTLYPSTYHDAISRYLSTLNGLMGSMHDDLIIDKFTNKQNYYDGVIEIPADIQLRLNTLTAKYQVPR